MDILNEVRKEKEIKNMNSKVKGVLQILLVLVLIAAFAFVASKGLGAGHRGSAKNIRLGLDLKGGVSVTYQAYVTDDKGKRTVKRQRRRQCRIQFTRCRSVLRVWRVRKLPYIRMGTTG